MVFGIVIYDTTSLKLRALGIFFGLLPLLPLFIMALKKTLHFSGRKREWHSDNKLFLLGTLFLTVLIGLLIPSVFIADSPQEYVDIGNFHNPLWYIVNSFCMAAGTFLIWMRVFY